MSLYVKNVNCGYRNHTVIKNISFELKSGEVLCLLGPNGVGKTTFFKTLLGLNKMQQGEILLDNKDIRNISTRELAKKIAYVPQAHNSSFSFNVFEVVLMGRTVYSKYFNSPSKEDEKIALECLEELDINHLINKSYTQLSGGEQQMVLIARALAQKADFLVMDEPTSNLDFGNQIKIINQIRKLSKKNKGIIMTTHSPEHVFLCGTKVLVFNNKEMIKVGVPEEVVTERLLKDIYNVNVKVKDIDIHNKVKDIEIYNKVKVCVPYFG